MLFYGVEKYMYGKINSNWYWQEHKNDVGFMTVMRLGD